MAPRATRVVTGVVRVYQLMRMGRLSPCRFVPSCSEYAIEAVETHGAMRGSWLAARRIVRCNPIGGYGSDPVPPSSTSLRSEHQACRQAQTASGPAGPALQ